MGKAGRGLWIKRGLKFSPLLVLLIALLIWHRWPILQQVSRDQLAHLTGKLIQWQHQLLTTDPQPENPSPQLVVRLQAENQYLTQQVAQLSREKIELQATQKYLADISELLEFKKQYNFANALTAQIIFKNFSSAEQFFYLNQGAQHGVKLNMVAFYDNCIVGRISTVYPTYSKLILITDKACKIAAYCSQSRTTGVFHGLNHIKRATLKHVHHMFELINGDLILSSGEGLIFPQGFALGVIKEFSCQDVDYDVLVEPVLDLAQLRYCLLK